MSETFDKLVRDAIPGIVKADGKEPVVHTVEGEEYGHRLAEKLIEEAEEYREDRDVAELADVLEVVHAIREHHGVTAEELREKRDEKAERRGRFADGVVLERVEE